MIKGGVENQEGVALTQALVKKFTDIFKQQLQEAENITELETLLVDFLEEVKLNYVKRLASEDVDRLIEERYKIYNVTQADA